jgi:hypothetical protein
MIKYYTKRPFGVRLALARARIGPQMSCSKLKAGASRPGTLAAPDASKTFTWGASDFSSGASPRTDEAADGKPSKGRVNNGANQCYST